MLFCAFQIQLSRPQLQVRTIATYACSECILTLTEDCVSVMSRAESAWYVSGAGNSLFFSPPPRFSLILRCPSRFSGDVAVLCDRTHFVDPTDFLRMFTPSVFEVTCF